MSTSGENQFPTQDHEPAELINPDQLTLEDLPSLPEPVEPTRMQRVRKFGSDFLKIVDIVKTADRADIVRGMTIPF